jgi:hypothetical protein
MEKTPSQIKGKSLIKLEKPLKVNSEKASIDIPKNDQKDLKDNNVEEEMILLNLKPNTIIQSTNLSTMIWIITVIQRTAAVKKRNVKDNFYPGRMLIL